MKAKKVFSKYFCAPEKLCDCICDLNEYIEKYDAEVINVETVCIRGDGEKEQAVLRVWFFAGGDE